MAVGGTGWLERGSRLIGRFRGLFLPFGLFAVVAVGVHAGSDRVDDHAFVLYNFLDAWIDAALVAVIRFGGDLFGVEPHHVDTATFWISDLVDLDLKDAAARATALGAELGADLLFAVPIFLFHRVRVSPIVYVRSMFHDFTLLRWVGPAAVAMAAASGVLVIAREVQVATHGAMAGSRMPELAGVLASLAGAFALVVVTWRLGVIAVRAEMAWADRRAEKDRSSGVSPRRRRMRGLLAAAVALPIAYLAAFEATPVLGTVRALLSW